MDWLDPEQVRAALSRPQDFKGCGDPSHIDQDGNQYARPSWALEQLARALAKNDGEYSIECEWHFTESPEPTCTGEMRQKCPPCRIVEVARVIVEAMGDERT